MTRSRETRLADNERIVREANEEAAAVALDDSGGEPADVELFCACGRPDCDERILMAVREYEAVHAQPHRFVVVPGHEQRELERVVETHGSYNVVEKRPEYQADDPSALSF